LPYDLYCVADAKPNNNNNNNNNDGDDDDDNDDTKLYLVYEMASGTNFKWLEIVSPEVSVMHM
jgi:hypothetical protein